MLRLPIALLVAALLGVVLSGARPAPVEAADIFPIGATGHDISFPQCSGPFPGGPSSFAIVGATGGKPFTQNPCLRQQWAWASTTARHASVYLNLKAPVGTNAEEAATGPAGVCRANDDLCRGYNFGYKSAQHAEAYARSQSAVPLSWWLDVETMNSWLSDTVANARVIAGAIDYLRGQGAVVGIYSNPAQWQTIAGSYAPGLPVWTTTAPGAQDAPAFCSRGFGGGQVVLVQYLEGGFDLNYACRPEDRLVVATATTPLGPVGALATIAAEGDCLNVRATPSLAGARSGCLASGTSVTLLDGAMQADGYRWQRISAGAVSGWVAATYLRLGAPSGSTVPPSPPSGTFTGAPVFSPSRQALVVFNGGTVDQLEAAAIAAGATGVWAQDGSGDYRLLVVRGPVFVNAAFRSAFASGLRSASALTLTR